MISIEFIQTFIVERLSCVSTEGINLYFFGSLAKGAESPNDIDVMIVYLNGNYGNAINVRKLFRESENKFIFYFGIPLNILVLSTEEFDNLPMKIDRMVKITVI